MSRRDLGVVVWLFLCAPGYAQTLGTITGEVKDQSNATIPGATVTAQNVATNAVRTQTSNEAGVYTFSAMPPGRYQVKAELQGFRTVQNSVELHVEETLRVNFSLDVGAITETTEVSAAVTLIATENATVGTVIENRRIVELPLNGRNYLSLIALSPNVSAGFAGPGQAGDRQGGSRAGQQISISGQRREFNYYTLDGVDNTDVNFNTYIFLPSVDALEEFKVQTGIYPAEFGRAAGQVNVVTKSGSQRISRDRVRIPPQRQVRRASVCLHGCAGSGAEGAVQMASVRLHGRRASDEEPAVLHVELRGLHRSQDVPEQLQPADGSDEKRGFLGARHAPDRSVDLHGRRHGRGRVDVPGQPDSGQSHSLDLEGAARVLSRTEPGAQRGVQLPVRAESHDRQEAVHAAHGLRAERGVNLDGPLQLRP